MTTLLGLTWGTFLHHAACRGVAKRAAVEPTPHPTTPTLSCLTWRRSQICNGMHALSSAMACTLSDLQWHAHSQICNGMHALRSAIACTLSDLQWHVRLTWRRSKICNGMHALRSAMACTSYLEALSDLQWHAGACPAGRP
jgi:hypothetical protein